MISTKPRQPRSRAATLHGHKPALDRIDARLNRPNPEDEQAKIDKAMLLLFGPEPSGFSTPEKYKALYPGTVSEIPPVNP